MSAVKVLIVDDSAVVRQVMTGVLAEDPAIHVLGAASDPIFALERMKREWPDVILLDIEMPRMDGITFLKKIMAEHPTPVVVCSTLTEQGAATTMQALQAGAVSIVTKPKLGLKNFLNEAALELIHTVKAAARSNRKNLGAPVVAPPKLSADAVLPPGAQAMIRTTDKVVALGASTGGTQALERVLTALPEASPGIVIVQHMPERFTTAFAQRLDSVCRIQVREAVQHDRVLPGQALLAPGGKHLVLRRNGAQYRVEVVEAPPVNRHRPSVDVLFRSVAQCAGANALGVIMTGMGDDGANGLLEMKQAGARTLAQDEASCVVFGMPKEAVKRGAAERVLHLDAIPEEILRFAIS